MKFKHGDSFKIVTMYYQQFDSYVQKNNINKPSDKENELVTFFSDSSTTLMCHSRAICIVVEVK